MTLAASFLGGARDRLLPASIPFRFFVAATLFHILAWTMLLAGAGELPEFAGGPGLILAALHLLTIGVLVIAAMGASYQLLPVAARHPLSRSWPAKLSFWLITPGTAVLAIGMVDASTGMLYVGGAGVSIGLLIFAGLTADNLWRASAMPIVAAHGWAALAALLGFLGLGLSLLADFDVGFLADRQIIATMHMILAAFGFMGLLVFGFSHILIPMFVLSRTLPVRIGWLEFFLAACAVLMTIFGLLYGNYLLVIMAALIGLAASASYFWLMRCALATRMRKRLGLSFILIYISWIMLAFSLLTGLAVSMELPIPNGSTLFGFLAIVGWLLTFLMGILQRIIPFLASMHAAGKNNVPPLLSELTTEGPLKVHAACHFVALVSCSAGIILNTPILVTMGAGLGTIGALAFSVFVGHVVLKLNPSR